MVLLVRVKLTVVSDASAAAFMVTCPQLAFNVTAVDLLVACVTVPPAPVLYPIALPVPASNGRFRSNIVIENPLELVKNANSNVPGCAKVITLPEYPCTPMVP